MNNSPITLFAEAFDFLSNFHEAPITWRGQVWPTSEHLFQAAKTWDQAEREQIRLAAFPGIAKKMGSPKGYKGFQITCRPDWDEVKVEVMERILWEKFTQNPQLGEQLLATEHRELIEGNFWNDEFWGVNLKKDPPVGENWLGRLLMLTRAKLRFRRELQKIAEDLQMGSRNRFYQKPPNWPLAS